MRVLPRCFLNLSEGPSLEEGLPKEVQRQGYFLWHSVHFVGAFERRKSRHEDRRQTPNVAFTEATSKGICRFVIVIRLFLLVKLFVEGTRKFRQRPVLQ